MALKTDCATPGATYSTQITSGSITVTVKLPMMNFVLYEDEARQLERNLHNAVELALAPLFARVGMVPRPEVSKVSRPKPLQT